MTRYERIVPTEADPSHTYRMMLDSVWRGQFDLVPLNYLDRLQWIDLAQWWADVDPADEAQVFAEVETALHKSDELERWLRLPERQQGPDFETWFDETHGDRK